MYLGKIIYYLVKAHRYKIGKLHFHHAFISFHAESQGGAYDGTFTERRIAHPLSPEFIDKPLRYFEYSSILCNILSHQYEVVVPDHALVQSIAHGIYQPFLLKRERGMRYIFIRIDNLYGVFIICFSP